MKYWTNRISALFLFFVIFSSFSSSDTLVSDDENDIENIKLFELGRMLFYDKSLSSNNQLSCSSCHIQKFSFTDSAKFSNGQKIETDRNSMTLLNLKEDEQMFWDGRAYSLEDQVIHPFLNKNELNISFSEACEKLKKNELYPNLFNSAFGSENITFDKIIKSIVYFEKQLKTSETTLKIFQDTTLMSNEEKKGYKLFTTVPNTTKKIRGAGCSLCHTGKTFDNTLFLQNGIKINESDYGREKISHLESERGKFKVPGLINIKLTAPYMHDGRFKTIDEVLNHYNENIIMYKSTSSFLSGLRNDKTKATGLHLTKEELLSLKSYLLSLYDKNIIQNSNFSNPFPNQ